MATGGCCDCGDPEAWAKCGNCTVHNGIMSDMDPSEVLPAELLQGMNAVLKGALGVLTSFAVSLARAYDCSTENVFVNQFQYFNDLEGEENREVSEHEYDEQGRTPREQFQDAVIRTNDTYCVTVHNDDVHTYENVIAHFRTHANMDAESATLGTKRVDQEGYMSVFEVQVAGGEDNLKINPMDDLHAIARALQTPIGHNKTGLLTSIAPKRLFELEYRVSATLNWMQELGKQNDGLRRAITNALLESHLDLPEVATALQDCYGICKPTEIFKDGLRFPNVIPQLQNMPLGMDTSDKDAQFVHSPFRRNCERNILGILMMASPFFMKCIKHALSSLVVIYQQDPRFKACFSQMLTILYPAIYGLFGRYIGTRHDEIFNTTVQVYTANKVVTMMSSNGLTMRPLREPTDNPVLISRMLAQTLYYTLLDIECLPDRQNDTFLLHHSLQSNRHQQLFRDFEYVTENVLGSLQLMCGTRDIGVLPIWIQVSLLLQNMYEMTRYTEAHVEVEDAVMWHTSTRLTLELESASTNIVSNSLFPSEELLAAESQAASGNLDDKEVSSITTESTPRSRSGSIVDFDLRRSQLQAVDNAVREVVRLGLNVWAASSRAKHGAPDASLSSCFGVDLNLPEGYTLLSYDVATSPVSVNNPVHRLLAKVFLFASYSNLNLHPALKHVTDTSIHSKIALADFPLRTLVFSVQVGANMWKRNGSAPENLVFHYVKSPINKVLKFMDIHCVQIALLSFNREIGADIILALAIDRFRVKSLLEDKSFFVLPGKINAAYISQRRMFEYQGVLLAGLLKVLISIVVCIPTCLLENDDPNHPGGNHADSIQNALSREIVNLVLSGASTLSELSIVTSMVGGDKTVSENTLNEVVGRLCTRREASEAGEKTTLDLKSSAYVFFDPEYGHLMQEQLNKSSDRVREWRKQLTRECGDSSEVTMHLPVLFPDALPAAHPIFERVRSLLFRPIMYKLLARSIELAIARVCDLGTAKRVVLERVVYILTLQVHFRARYQLENSEEFGGISLSQSPEHYAFLKAIADLWLSDAFSEDEYYKNGLAFVLELLVRTEDRFVRNFFEIRGILFASPLTSAELGTDDKMTLCLISVQQAQALAEKARLLKLKSAAQQKAIATMQKASSNFMMQMEGWSDDDSDEDEKGATSGVAESANHRMESSLDADLKKQGVQDDYATCMICRKSANEETQELRGTDNSLGYLCFLQPSNNVKHAVSSSDSHQHMLKKVFRVVSPMGCFVYVRVIASSPLDPINSSYVCGRLARGEHVLVSRRLGRWVHILAPMSGWVEIYTERMRFKGESTYLTAGLFEQSTCNESCKEVILVRNLHPVDDFLFARHGATRLHASSCGHCMHFSCWNEYFANTVRRETSYLYAHDPPLAFDVLEGEFTCPLCKNISNAFLPITTPASVSQYWALPTEGLAKQTQSTAFDEWLVNFGHRKASSTVMFSVNMLLNTPDIPVWGGGKESVRLLESISALYALPWRTELENVLVKLPDADGHKEIQLTRGCHSLWTCIAYTLQSQYCASLWTIGGSGAASAAALGPETIGIAAQLLNMLRQMPNWFEGLESFADCIGTPLKLLVSGCRTDVEDEDTSDAVLNNTCVAEVRPVDELTIAECREALLGTPFETVGSNRFPSPRRVSLLLRILHHKGIQSCDLWGTLTVPLLAQDLTGIAVASVACSADIRSAEAVLGILCFARLCQVLIEPSCTGVASSNNTELLSSLKAVGEAHLPDFKTTKNPNTKGPLMTFSDPGNDSNAVCQLLKQLQSAVISAAGLDSTNEITSSEKLRGLVFDAWIPYLEFIVCLLHSLRCATSGHAEAVPNLRKSTFETLLSLTGLPASLPVLLANPILSMLGSRWGDQLGYVRPGRLRGKPAVSWIPKSGARNPFDFEKKNERDGASDTCTYGTAEPLVEEVMHQIKQLHALEQERLQTHEHETEDSGSRTKGNHEAGELLDFLPKILGTTTEYICQEYEQSLRAAGAKAISQTGHQTAFARSLAKKIVFTVKDNAAKEIGRPLLEDYADFEAVDSRNERAEELSSTGFFGMLGADGASNDEFNLTRETGAAGSGTIIDLSIDILRSEPLKTWKLVGVDPCYRTVDGGFAHLEFTNMSTSDIQSVHTQSPFVGAIHGQSLSYDPSGQPLSTSFCDMSHLPVRCSQRGGLLHLPTIYTELIDCIELPYEPKLDEQGKREDEPALCLICGSILNAGNRAKKLTATPHLDNALLKESPGECTLHARTCGAGVGVFMFLLQNQVYLMRGGRSSKYGALYLDKNGETGEARGHNRPLVLSKPRFQKLEELYIRHQIASEVTRKRLSQDRSIRSFYY